MKVPISADGGIQHYPEKSWGYDEADRRSFSIDVKWDDIDTFQAFLVLEGLERGRSAAYFWWKDRDSDATYPMFMKDMVELLKYGQVYHGTVFGKWAPAKRGENYGIKHVV